LTDPSPTRAEGDELDHATSRTGPTTQPARDEARPAVDRPEGRPVWPVLVGLTLVVAVADQVTKSWLVGFLRPRESVEVIGDWLRLVHGQNNGGLFGLFAGQAAVFAIASIGVIALILVYHARSGRSPLLSVALGLLLGGAVGNLLDRVTRGYVVDFVDAGIGDLRWYTFNVADAAISAAIVLLIVLSIWPNPTWSPTRRQASPGG
jgi:signal peptidase II